MPFLASLARIADRLTHSWTTRIAINKLFLHRYGTMTQLKIDPATKSIDMELELLGETSPIHVHIDRYTFEKLPPGDAMLVVSGITVSRPWMQELAKNLLESKPHAISAQLAGYLSMVL